MYGTDILWQFFNITQVHGNFSKENLILPLQYNNISCIMVAVNEMEGFMASIVLNEVSAN